MSLFNHFKGFYKIHSCHSNHFSNLNNTVTNFVNQPVIFCYQLVGKIGWEVSNGFIFIQFSTDWPFNPYWQIMENSSRNFSESFIFLVVT